MVWRDTENPRLSWEVALGRARGMFIHPARIPPAQAFRAAIRAQLRALLGDDSVLAIPTTRFPAPTQGQRRSITWDLRVRLGGLTHCRADRFPQVNLPLGLAEGRPMGPSLIAPPGREDILLHMVEGLGHLAVPARA